MALTAETESRLYRSLRVASGAAAHLVALGFPAAVAVLARPGSSLFSWHPLLMALAFSFLMTEALLIFSPETSLLRSFSRKVRVRCAGGVLLLYPKLMKNWTLAKLKLYHATSGLVGYLLGCASLMLGMCSLWFTTTVTGASWYLAMLCPLVTSLVIMNQVSNAYLYRKRSQH
ncbi:C56D2 protein, partial [Pheucticus melanocephalus]|nr:C56D2 protein [Pheucticus melanocephalus]